MSDPRFREPMLATLADAPPRTGEWVYERKLDGIRLVVVRDGDRVHLYTRNRTDHSRRYPELVDALLDQPSDRFVADGEVVAFDGNTTSFSRLQQRSGIADPAAARRSGVAVHLYLFDLLHLGDVDTDRVPLRKRKTMLRDTVVFDDPVRYCAHRNEEYLDEACSKGWEGLIAKRADGPYRGGRSRDWLKLKCVARQELVIGGWTEPQGSRHGLGALLVGHHRDGSLVYAGRVGTGFDDAALDHLSTLLDGIPRDDPPFADPPGGPGLHWVEPQLVCEVGFTEWTTAGRLRHPRFLGLRDDKDPAEVVRETPRSAP